MIQIANCEFNFGKQSASLHLLYQININKTPVYDTGTHLGMIFV